MPNLSEIADRRARLRAEILRRVAAGEALRAICRDPGMPDPATVHRWAEANPALRAELSAAIRAAQWRRRRAFDDAKAAALLRRLAGGEALRTILRDRAMPGRATLRYWRASQGEFAAELTRLIGVNRGQRLAAGAPRARPFDAKMADRVLLWVGRGHSYAKLRRIDPTLPGGRLIDRWRRERPEFDWELRVNIEAGRRARARARMAAVTESLCERIVMGGSIRSLGGKHGLPSWHTLYDWMRRDPAFARRVSEACEDRKDWFVEHLVAIAEQAPLIGAAEAKRRMAPLSRRAGILKHRRPGAGRGR